MQKLKSFAFVILFGIAALGLTPAPAKALVIYSYAGNNFDSFVNQNPPVGSYDTTMSVSGSFTVAAPLLSLGSLTDISASVLSFSFSDGRQTLSSAPNPPVIALATDSTGAPTSWNLFFFQPFPSPTFIGSHAGGIFTFSGRHNTDGGDFNTCTSIKFLPGFGDICTGVIQDTGQIRGSPGVWTVTVSPVPEPSTLLLFGVGLAGLAGFARRRRHA